MRLRCLQGNALRWTSHSLLNFPPMKHWIAIPCLLALLVASASAKTKTAPAPAAPAATQPPAEMPVAIVRSSAASLPVNLGVVAQGAAQSGIRRCLPRIDQVVNFLSAGAQTGAMVFVPPTDADNRQSSVTLEMLGSNGLSYVDTSYAPNAVGCDAMYQTVTYWTDSCEQVAKVAFPHFAKSTPLRQYIGILDGGPSAKVFLMPAGPGCISIKKEVLF